MKGLLGFLGDSGLGVFGAGHLGRAVACGLLDAGLPKEKLALCCRGSRETLRKLAEAGLEECVAESAEVVEDSKVLLYIVRPQSFAAIGEFDPRPDALLVSFLAGVPLERIPAALPESRRVRVMPSAPDTILKRDGIAAAYPAGNALVDEMLSALGLRVFALQQEEDMHAFTALAVCLPIALTCWEALGRRADEGELLDLAERHGLSDFAEVLEWARRVQPRGLSPEERERYAAQAATPGGVTEAILAAMAGGESLADALAAGVRRSREMAG